jgi:hypothetical protein
MNILSKPALEFALRRLGDFLKFELQHPDWEVEFDTLEEGASICLFPPTWRLKKTDEYVAFSFYWSNESTGDAPSVQFCLPPKKQFPQRNQLLDRIRPQLKRAGFTDHYEGEEDPDPCCPLWKNIRLEFNEQTGFDLPAIRSEILKGFQELMAVEKSIEEAFQSMPAPPPPSERKLKTIAVLDTEWKGSGSTRKISELTIVNVAYDPVADDLVGILERYDMLKGKKLDEAKARALLNRSERIAAHNSSGDQTLLERELPGIDKRKWLCSFRGIEWKRLIGVKRENQETLLGRVGLSYEQDHHARGDVDDLIQLLAQRHHGGGTYLGRLLDGEGQRSS